MPGGKKPKASTGPPQALIERVNYLKQLLVHLPETLPLDPPASLYRLYLDEDRVAEAETVFPEACRALEVSFGTWQRKDTPVKFVERGLRLAALVPFLKAAIKRMSPSERDAFDAAWIEKLIHGAKESGASIPPRNLKRASDQLEGHESEDIPAPKKSRKRGAPITIYGSDSDIADEPSCQPNVPKQTLASDVVVPSTAGRHWEQWDGRRGHLVQRRRIRGRWASSTASAWSI
ncbi:hypothetical protein DFH09DRAFT_1482298 [Mycena vulgaris]|nr:hypothetical protein DFH09DRAFT_1482298 [Mycena vulgaris]